MVAYLQNLLRQQNVEFDVKTGDSIDLQYLTQIELSILVLVVVDMIVEFEC